MVDKHEPLPAGQYKHGLLFFQVGMPRKLPDSWQENLGLTIDVLHHQRGPLVAEEAIPHRFEPFLPSTCCNNGNPNFRRRRLRPVARGGRQPRWGR